jgi:nifR3 family TIM-barrel protein
MSDAFEAWFANRPVLLAPMEDVTDAAFRRVCRRRGAQLCFTEFVHVEHALTGQIDALRKLDLAADDRPTAVQIYGSDASRLAEAAELAASSNPAFVDINCGCWVPRVAARGAGAAWLREPDAMVAMVREVVRRCPLPVTVKTRIGFGPESHMPIVDLARRLEDAGARAITVHCRTAAMGHEGRAEWAWAARAQEVVAIPVVLNGDVTSASDARRALTETACAGVMVGRRAIQHPWIFREVRALLDTGVGVPRPTHYERRALCVEYVSESVREHGERSGVRRARRLLPAWIRALPGGRALGDRLLACENVAEIDDVFGEHDGEVVDRDEERPAPRMRRGRGDCDVRAG